MMVQVHEGCFDHEISFALGFRLFWVRLKSSDSGLSVVLLVLQVA